LVTGGAGFIGSHLVDTLVARGFAVRVLDDFSTGTLANLAFTRNKVDLCFGDLSNQDLLHQMMKGVDFVFHLASSPSWDAGEEDGPQENVVRNTINLLRAARDAEVRRVIFASSGEVYGRGPSYPFSESDSFRPASSAGMTKVAEEEQCLAFTQLYGL